MAKMEETFKWKYFYNQLSFLELGIEVVDNTPDEIMNAFVEINKRLDNLWEGPTIPVSRYLSTNNISCKSDSLFPAVNSTPKCNSTCR